MPYTPEDYYQLTNVRLEQELQLEPERGERCRRCYLFRMKKAYEYAAEHHFDFMTTTLSLSPHKDAQAVNAIGRDLEAEHARQAGIAHPGSGQTTRFLYADFKKQNGYKRSLELSEKYHLYRQSYCGCEFSLYNTTRK
jgi:predicted adenine nucleotide alpha hydrolase (AANH) superfamily ATPase